MQISQEALRSIAAILRKESELLDECHRRFAQIHAEALSDLQKRRAENRDLSLRLSVGHLGLSASSHVSQGDQPTGTESLS